MSRPALRVLLHHPQMRGRARVEVLEAEPGDIDRDHALIGRGTGRVRLSGALARRSLHGLRQTEEDERERQDAEEQPRRRRVRGTSDRKSTRLNSSHVATSYAVFCLKNNRDEAWRQ